ncbi:MAG: hypothetical protein EYC70_00540 [Planctomycetota bacterium]|nr:MAG: hypothetical protein EYC70_00540 [Planctomycetota bacterium]
MAGKSPEREAQLARRERDRAEAEKLKAETARTLRELRPYHAWTQPATVIPCVTAVASIALSIYAFNSRDVEAERAEIKIAEAALREEKALMREEQASLRVEQARIEEARMREAISSLADTMTELGIQVATAKNELAEADLELQRVANIEEIVEKAQQVATAASFSSASLLFGQPEKAGNVVATIVIRDGPPRFQKVWSWEVSAHLSPGLNSTEVAAAFHRAAEEAIPPSDRETYRLVMGQVAGVWTISCGDSEHLVEIASLLNETSMAITAADVRPPW